MPNTSENGNPWTFYLMSKCCHPGNSSNSCLPAVYPFSSSLIFLIFYLLLILQLDSLGGYLSDSLDLTALRWGLCVALDMVQTSNQKLPPLRCPSPPAPRYDRKPSQVLFTPIRLDSFQSCLGKLKNKGEWVKITFIIRLSRDSGNRMKTIIVINLTIAVWAFLHSVLKTDHYFEVKNCFQAERWIRWIHI